MTRKTIGARINRGALMGLSRFFMLPLFHHWRGPRPTRWGGSICVLRTRGRKSGLLREAPLDYAPTSDGILVAAGFGERTHWLLNIRADPRVEVGIGRTTYVGIASEIGDSHERLAAMRAVLQHCGFVGYVFGFSPFTVSDERLERAAQGVTVVRVTLDRPPPASHLAAG
jgi:deazaflavin-dependent oxidoreductase (nitroreductase family)